LESQRGHARPGTRRVKSQTGREEDRDGFVKLHGRRRRC
jgi:hypothetical protein